MSGMPERLQKLIARAGLASRRTAESLIQAGAVRVNGRVVTRLGAKADPRYDRIEVEGRLLRFPESDLYLVLNKPRGYVSTAADPKGRPTVLHLLRGLRQPRPWRGQRVVPVGRLPYDVEGLLLLTSDGAFADTILRGRLPQTYWFKVKGQLSPEETAQVERVAGRRQPAGFRLRLIKPGANPWYEVTLVEPRDDRLRTALFRSGHPVEKVKRMAVGPLRLSSLAPGNFRELSHEEMEQLAAAAVQRSSGPRRRKRLAG
jgi:23S rRNA pseudouridine2605 synthase